MPRRPRRLSIFHRRRPGLSRPALALAAGGRARCIACRRCRGSCGAFNSRVSAQTAERCHHLRAACRHVHPGRHLRRRGGQAFAPGRSRRHSSGVAAVGDIPGGTWLGLRWGRSVRALAGVRTPQDLARFVRACHDRGLAVLLDVVYNHLGPDGNYLKQFGPYFTDKVKTPWGEAINYDGAGERRCASLRR